MKIDDVVDILPFEVGANAAAEPTREATIAAFMVNST
jgi:hypothetical protein